MSLTSFSPAGPPDDSSVVAQVARVVEELADLAGLGCLLEGADGRLLAHHLVPGTAESAPPTVVQALVTGRLNHLHDGLLHRRATGRMPAGRMVEGRLADDGLDVAQLVLREGLGTVWLLLGTPGSLPLDTMAGAADRLRLLLAATSDGSDGSTFRRWLDGQPDAALPEPFRSAARLWLVATSAASSVARALPAPLAAKACGAFTVVAAPVSMKAAQLAATVERVLPPGHGAVLTPVGDNAKAAREALDTARFAAPEGRCVALQDARSAVVVRRLGESLAALPDLGRDPLALLEDYDVRRGSQLVSTLRAWLDGFGDGPRVAEEVGVHANTLRYRLGRIQQITGVDLRHDPLGRLELHARLVAR